jgi:myo-inositol-1-phosphate synthase
VWRFVNALPVFIASAPEWARKFTDAGVPIVGDDIKSQVGATITHRVPVRLFEDRPRTSRSPRRCSTTTTPRGKPWNGSSRGEVER